MVKFKSEFQKSLFWKIKNQR